MLDYIAYITVRLLNIIFMAVPISLTLWLGRRIGAVLFMFNKKRRLVAYANLKAAFAREKSPQELRLITKRVYQNMVQTFIEIINLTKVDQGYIARYVEVVNFERIQTAAKSGRGVILLTGHFGDWELSSLTSAIKGYPILVLAREQKMQRLNELLNRLRESKGCKVIPKGITTKYILKALYDKNIVGILSDQDAGKLGVFVNFFGRPTSTHAGPAEIAKRTDSIILPNFIARINGPYHKLFLEEYIDFRDSKSDDDIRVNLQKFADILESYIRRYPDQWLWMHKRWKSTPVRNVLVLNDGKAGHLNQSLAVAEAVRSARAARGYDPADTRVTVIDVKHRSVLRKAALSLCANLAGWRCHGCMRCMKLCLEKESYDELMKTYADFVISCGSRLAGVNILMSKENNASSIVVMKPALLTSLNKFDLAVIPRHDRPRNAKNVVITQAAPNLIDPHKLELEGRKLKEMIHPDKRHIIGFLAGGDNAEYLLTKETIDKVTDDLTRFCNYNDANLVATTSRRTSGEVERALKAKLEDNALCKLLVIANERNVEGLVPGILAVSDLVVVSGESISMISEAISSGRKVVVFELTKRRKYATKHERALKGFEIEGYIALSNADSFYERLKSAWLSDGPRKELKDREVILEAVKRLI